jgi:hypothetical protein
MTAADVAWTAERSGLLPGPAGRRYRPAGASVLLWMLAAALLASCSGGHSKVREPPAGRPTDPTAAPPRRGYWVMSDDGQIFPFGAAVGYGSHVQSLNRPLVCMSSTPSGRGYWLVAADGGIFAFGDAHYYGSAGAALPSRPIVAMTTTPTGRGYWLVAANGTVFGFGDGHVYSSIGGRSPNPPVVGIAATPRGRGYWLVAADGGISGFGDARYYGSARSVRAPIVGMAPSPSGNGYRVVAADGRVFVFGDARFYGSAVASAAARPIVAVGATPTGNGYWLARADGSVFAFGDAPRESTFKGSKRPATIVGMAGLGEAGICHVTARPADIAPPSPAIAAEGHWIASAGPVGGEPAIYTTILRAQAGLPAAGLAWIDTNRVVFRLYAGARQPPGTFLYSGAVQPSLQPGLLATFNGGFMVNASEGGWFAYGQTGIPLRDGAASLIIRGDGTAFVGEWGRDATASAHLVAVRQNLRLLVDGGKVASDLSPQSWGAVFGGGTTTWRSGIGTDAKGHLIYAVGASLLPADLAHLLLAAGSVRAMQLDINRVVSFSTFTRTIGSPPQTIVGTNLLPTMNFDPTRYLHPSGRDFIAVFAK